MLSDGNPWKQESVIKSRSVHFSCITFSQSKVGQHQANDKLKNALSESLLIVFSLIKIQFRTFVFLFMNILSVL